MGGRGLHGTQIPLGTRIVAHLERSLTRARKRSRVLRIDLQGLTKVIESPPRVASLEE